MKKTLLFSVLLLLGVLVVAAQQANDTLQQQLPEVVITPTLLEQPLSEAPRSVNLVSAPQIQLLQPLDLAQMLSLLPGTSVVGSGLNPGSVQSVFLRGTNSNHSLVLIDGVRISDPSTPNGALDLSELPLSSFASLEVLRGSQSTGFGNGALGGIISLNSPGWYKQGLNLSFAASAGSFGPQTLLLQQQLDAGYSFANGFYGRISFTNKNVKGLDATVDTINDPQAFERYDNDDFSLQRGTLKIGYEKNKWKGFVIASLNQHNADYDKKGFKYNNPFGENPWAWYDGDRAEIDFSRLSLGYNLQGPFFAQIQFRLFGGYSSNQRSVVDDSSIVRLPNIYDHTFSSSEYEGQSMHHDAQLIWKATEALTVLGGAGILQESMSFHTHYFSNSAWGPYTFETNLDTLPSATIAHAFLQAEVSFGSWISALKPLHLVAGLRYSHHNQFGGRPDVLINPLLKLGNGMVAYASWSTGYQAPSLYQMYAPDKYFLSDVTRGNPDLKPEQANSSEIGFRLHAASGAMMQLAFFRNNISNAIEYCYLWDENIPVDSLGTDWYRDDYRGDTYLNAGKLVTQGVEASLHLPILRWVELDANVSLLDGKLHYGPELLQAEHAHGHQVQLFYSGAFPALKDSVAPLVRRSSAANARVTVKPISSLKLFGQARWIGKRNDIFYDVAIRPYGAQNASPLDAYLLFDFGLFYQPFSRVSAALRVENVFNTPFTEILGYTTRPRGYFLTAYFQR
ncbi:MAG: TonB-dependent receptor [Chitinophagales bacterium]|nr:TonB-dependent receptor [Chitinophagales bacterium]MDW8427301.1 TonB-dependent receptor [Chitinophagales bacterium]